MIGEFKVLHQKIGVASNKVIGYIVEDEIGIKHEISTDKLISYVKMKSVENVELYQDSLLVFHGNSNSMKNFIIYEFSDKVKKEITNYYNLWKQERERELALNMKPDFELDYCENNGLYYLKNAIMNKEAGLAIPSFIVDIYDDTSSYYKSNIVPMLAVSDYDKWAYSDVFVDKYTNCLLSEMFVGWHKNITLNGLISIIENEDYVISSVIKNEYNNSISLDTEETFLSLYGKTRYVKKSSFQYLCRKLNLNCNSNLRVLNLDTNIKNIKVSDLTLLVGNSDCSREIIKSSNIKGKDVLLDYKNYLSVYFDGYSNLFYTIKKNGIEIEFDNKQTELDALYLFKKLKDASMMMERDKIIISSNTKSGDSLFWEIKTLISERYDELSISYAFATVI